MNGWKTESGKSVGFRQKYIGFLKSKNRISWDN